MFKLARIFDLLVLHLNKRRRRLRLGHQQVHNYGHIRTFFQPLKFHPQALNRDLSDHRSYNAGVVCESVTVG